MPRGTPKIGNRASAFSGAQVLGSITDPKLLDPQPQSAQTQYETPSGSIAVTEPPPPWELEDSSSPTQSDARRYVTPPDNITLRWINPRVLDSEGWRDWQPVMVSDKRFKVNVQTMVTPEGNIRRGGPNGDLLAWMPTSWVESRRRLMAAATARQTNNAKAEQEKLFEDFKRGKYGPYMHLDSGKHPTHTMAEGRSMKD
jgi:hypothetical protein